MREGEGSQGEGVVEEPWGDRREGGRVVGRDEEELVSRGMLTSGGAGLRSTAK